MSRDLFERFCVLSISATLFCLMPSNLFAAEVASETATLLVSAQEAWKEGDLETSGNLYRKIIAASPGTIDAITAYQDLAIMYIQNDRTVEAGSLVKSFISKYAALSETSDALYSIAQQYRQKGLLDEAVSLHRYNSSIFVNTKKGLWSQGAIVHNYIEHKDYINAQKEFNVMLERFKDRQELPQEIHQVGEKYREAGEVGRLLEIHRYNVEHSPVSSKYTMWSQGAIVHCYIRQKDFVSARRECDEMIKKYSSQPTLPQELHLIAEMYKWADKTDMALELNQYNSTHSPVSSMYTMQSQGAIIHYYIEQKDFYPAETEYKDLLIRFKDQPTLPQEIYQFALKYDSVGNVEKALELHRYNAQYSTASSLYAMQSQGAIINHYIERRDFTNAQKEYQFMLDRFKEQPTLPQEIYQFADKNKRVGNPEKAFEVHRYNVKNSPIASLYTLQSQGEIVCYYIERKDLVNAQDENQILLDRFKGHPNLSEEIYRIALKYQNIGEDGKALQIHHYNADNLPLTSKHAMWSQGAIVHYYIEHKDFVNAEKEYDVMVRRFKDQATFPQEICQFADKYRQVGQYEQANILCQYGIETYPASTWETGFYKVMIRVCLETKDYKKAESITDKLMAASEDRLVYIKSMIDLGNIYRETKLWKQSIQYYREALTKAETPDDIIEAYTGMAQAFVWLDDERKVLEIEDSLISQYKNTQSQKLAYYTIRIGEEYLSMAQNIDGAGEPNDLARMYYSKAIAAWQRFENAVPNHDTPQYSYYSGWIYKKLGQYEQAINCYQKVLTKWPSYEKAWHAQFMVAESLREHMAPQEKITEALNILMERYPSNPAKDYVRSQLQMQNVGNIGIVEISNGVNGEEEK